MRHRWTHCTSVGAFYHSFSLGAAGGYHVNITIDDLLNDPVEGYYYFTVVDTTQRAFCGSTGPILVPEGAWAIELFFPTAVGAAISTRSGACGGNAWGSAGEVRTWWD